MTRIPIHLVSDSTGETVALVSRACLVQFDDVEPEEHLWSLANNPSVIGVPATLRTLPVGSRRVPTITTTFAVAPHPWWRVSSR